MQPSPTYWIKHLVKAAIEEVKDDYKEQGYSVKINAQLGDISVDLIASKHNHKIFFEFKAKGLQNRSPSQLLEFQRLVQAKPHAELRFIYVSPPTTIQVEVEDIERKIEDQLMNDLPSELDALSTHTAIDEVSDVEVTTAQLTPGKISLAGHCNVGVTLQYGSNSDVDGGEGHVSSDSFPAEFELEMNGDLVIQSLEITIDTSSFYGETEE